MELQLMATNTIYNPPSFPLDSSKVRGYGQGARAVCAALGSTNIDLDITSDCIITGLVFTTIGASDGDSAVLKIVTTANKTVVVATPLPGPWYLTPSDSQDFRLEFPMKIVSGLTLRCVISTTVLLVTPTVAVNYKLWECLI